MNVKKLLVGSTIGVVALSATLALPLIASASSSDNYVLGQVYNSKTGNGVNNVTVHVTCGTASEDVSTGAGNNGDYQAAFASNVCPKNSKASATVDSVTVDGKVNQQLPGIDYALINVPISVPEFGLIPGAFAALTAAGAYLGMRKRKN
jgi:hypothetical protein